MPPERLATLSQLYPIWLCDIWGVMHNGHAPFASAVSALQRHRAGGGKVILVSNAPRPRATIMAALDRMGVAREAYDDMATSGDVTRGLMVKHGGGGLFHLGPEHDLPLFEGLGLERVPLSEAGAVICSGFFDDRRDTPETYAPLLQEMAARKLAMICANPDKVVRIGQDLVPCAGAIAEAYTQMGGEVLMAGKPHGPIYELALQKAGNPPREQVLAIGDGPETDVAGAVAQGFPIIYVTGGINAAHDAEARLMREFPAARLAAAMPELEWR